MEGSHLSAKTQALITAFISFVTLPIAYFIRFHLMHGSPSYGLTYYCTMALFSSLLHFIIYRVGFYTRSDLYRHIGKQFQRTIVCESACTLLVYGALYVVGVQYISRIAVFISFLLNMLLICGMHGILFCLIRSVRRSGYYQRTILLVGEGAAANHYVKAVYGHPEAGHQLLGYVASRPQRFSAVPEESTDTLPYLGDYDELEQVLLSVSPEEVIIALSAAQYVHIDAIIATCEHNGIPLKIIPCYEARISSQLSTSIFEGVKMVDIRTIPLDRLYNALIKRSMDVFISLAALILLAPLMLIIAIGVKLSTHDSVFFTQVRVGKDKKPFKMIKFRSMKRNDSEDTAWSTQEDDRRTYFGALIRKFSLDELPQLFNVLKGDMSIIGPRPEIPCYVEQFRDEIPLYMIRHRVKPGMTGYAQVHGLRGDTSIKERIEYDVSYIENWSIWLDLRILLMTVPSLVNDEKLPTHRPGD